MPALRGGDQQSTDTGVGSESHDSPSDTSMEVTNLVPQITEHAGTIPNENSQSEGHDYPSSSGKRAGNSATVGHVDYLRQRFQGQNISTEGTELLLASWRQKSSQSYDSLFRKWVAGETNGILIPFQDL